MVHRLLFWLLLWVIGNVLSVPTRLTYVCNPELNDYSVLNPKPSEYHYALVVGKNKTACDYSFSSDYKTFNISSCEHGAGKVVNVMLSGEPLDGIIVGGQAPRIYGLSCDKQYRTDMTEIVIEADVVWNNGALDSGFSQEFKDSATVQVAVRDLQGVEGYTYMRIGYPLTVELLGPAGSRMKPIQCMAYSHNVSESSKKNLLIENGCTADKFLIGNFTENLPNWYDHELEASDSGVILHAEGTGTAEEEDETAETQPFLATHLYAFRFYDSRKVVVRCDIQLCPSDSDECDLSCEG